MIVPETTKNQATTPANRPLDGIVADKNNLRYSIASGMDPVTMGPGGSPRAMIDLLK